MRATVPPARRPGTTGKRAAAGLAIGALVAGFGLWSGPTAAHAADPVDVPIVGLTARWLNAESDMTSADGETTCLRAQPDTDPR